MARRPEQIPLHRDEDWIGTADDMVKRVRPTIRMDQAIIVAAAILGLCGVWAASKLQERRTPPYEFLQQEGAVFVLDRYTGDVAACLFDGTTTLCSEADSAMRAMVREAAP